MKNNKKRVGEACRECHGTGKIPCALPLTTGDTTCSHCLGTGWDMSAIDGSMTDEESEIIEECPPYASSPCPTIID